MDLNWQENVRFPAHYKPLPPGYRIVQLDSGHYLWVYGSGGGLNEGSISVDRYWVRRCVFADHEGRLRMFERSKEE